MGHKKAEPTEPLRLPRSVVRKLRSLALDAGMAPGDYFAREFGELIDDRHTRMLRDQLRDKEQQSPEEPVKKGGKK
jgi:hypothetical protein